MLTISIIIVFGAIVTWLNATKKVSSKQWSETTVLEMQYFTTAQDVFVSFCRDLKDLSFIPYYDSNEELFVRAIINPASPAYGLFSQVEFKIYENGNRLIKLSNAKETSFSKKNFIEFITVIYNLVGADKNGCQTLDGLRKKNIMNADADINESFSWHNNLEITCHKRKVESKLFISDERNEFFREQYFVPNTTKNDFGVLIYRLPVLNNIQLKSSTDEFTKDYSVIITHINGRRRNQLGTSTFKSGKDDFGYQYSLYLEMSFVKDRITLLLKSFDLSISLHMDFQIIFLFENDKTVNLSFKRDVKIIRSKFSERLIKLNEENVKIFAFYKMLKWKIIFPKIKSSYVGGFQNYGLSGYDCVKEGQYLLQMITQKIIDKVAEETMFFKDFYTELS